MHKNGGKITVK